MQDGARRTIRSVFPEDFCFPAPGSMSAQSLAEKLDLIEETLEKHSIFIDLMPELDDETAYERFLREFLDCEIPPESPMKPVRPYACEGSCPDCFRKNHCDAAGELDADEYL